MVYSGPMNVPACSGSGIALQVCVRASVYVPCMHGSPPSLCSAAGSAHPQLPERPPPLRDHCARKRRQRIKPPIKFCSTGSLLAFVLIRWCCDHLRISNRCGCPDQEWLKKYLPRACQEEPAHRICTCLGNPTPTPTIGPPPPSPSLRPAWLTAHHSCFGWMIAV